MIAAAYQPFFADAGVRLLTFACHPEIYPQLYGPFIQNLSALDLLFCCGPKAPGVLRGWLREPAALLQPRRLPPPGGGRYPQRTCSSRSSTISLAREPSPA